MQQTHALQLLLLCATHSTKNARHSRPPVARVSGCVGRTADGGCCGEPCASGRIVSGCRRPSVRQSPSPVRPSMPPVQCQCQCHSSDVGVTMQMQMQMQIQTRVRINAVVVHSTDGAVLSCLGLCPWRQAYVPWLRAVYSILVDFI